MSAVKKVKTVSYTFPVPLAQKSKIYTCEAVKACALPKLAVTAAKFGREVRLAARSCESGNRVIATGDEGSLKISMIRPYEGVGIWAVCSSNPS